MEHQDNTIHEIVDYHRNRANKAEDAHDKLFVKYAAVCTVAWSLGAALVMLIGTLIWWHA